jgi:hypothetical protein
LHSRQLGKTFRCSDIRCSAVGRPDGSCLHFRWQGFFSSGDRAGQCFRPVDSREIRSSRSPAAREARTCDASADSTWQTFSRPCVFLRWPRAGMARAPRVVRRGKELCEFLFRHSAIRCSAIVEVMDPSLGIPVIGHGIRHRQTFVCGLQMRSRNPLLSAIRRTEFDASSLSAFFLGGGTPAAAAKGTSHVC